MQSASERVRADTRAFYASRPSGVGPQSYEELLAVRAAAGFAGSVPRPGHFAGTPPPGVVVTSAVAPGLGRPDVPVRVCAPADGAVRGVFLQLHGGGFYMGSAASFDAWAVWLSAAAGVTVVSVDYRLAPEHPWPAAPDDVETAALWALSRFAGLPLVVGGDSAGATLSLGLLLRLRDRLGVGALVERVAGAVLLYGAYDYSGVTPWGRAYRDDYFISAYLGDSSVDPTLADVSPFYGLLDGLAPALLVVGADDVVLEDSLVMDARLRAAGVAAELRIYPECPHGFAGHATPMAELAWAGIAAWIRERWETRTGSAADSSQARGDRPGLRGQADEDAPVA